MRVAVRERNWDPNKEPSWLMNKDLWYVRNLRVPRFRQKQPHIISARHWIRPIELTRLQPELGCEWSLNHAYELAWLLWNMWGGYLRHYQTPGELPFLVSCLCDLSTVLLMWIECKPQLQPRMGLSASQPMLFRAQNICSPLDHFWIISSIFMLN